MTRIVGGTIHISIHAPLAGRDLGVNGVMDDLHNFNPRAPCGARPKAACGDPDTVAISIHAPLAGRDNGQASLGTAVHISIHAPLAGRD